MQSRLRKSALIIDIILCLGMCLLFYIAIKSRDTDAYYYGISFSIIVFHLTLRLVTGPLVRFICKGKPKPTLGLFKPRKGEERIYKYLRVKKWKNLLPTHYPDTFNLHKHNPEDIIETMCESEMIHLSNMILSIISVVGFLVIYPAQKITRFCFLTSIPLIIVESLFCMIQRYNRPRFMKVIARQMKRGKE